MKVGCVLPQTAIGKNIPELRTFVHVVERLGYEHLLTYEHVLGVDPNQPDWDGPFDINDPFHEPLTLFSYLSGISQSLEFVTGIMILPQRQTALVAKQIAELDILSKGRIRPGVGVGWNQPEYEALGMSFEQRGRRIEEQIEVMQKLWTQKTVTYSGNFHELNDVGLTMSPWRDKIPVWMGGMAEPVLDRIARTADGWLPQLEDPREDEAVRYRQYLKERCETHRRSVDDVGIHARLKVGRHSEAERQDIIDEWHHWNADYLSVNTMYQDLDFPGEHLDQLESLADELEL